MESCGGTTQATAPAETPSTEHGVSLLNRGSASRSRIDQRAVKVASSSLSDHLQLRFGPGPSSRCKLRPLCAKLAQEIKEFMGPDILQESLQLPGWKHNLMVGRERTAWRKERQTA